MVPQPVTTPSPGMMVSAMPKSVARWVTNMSYSSKLPGSSSTSSRSRAVSLPLPCCASMRRCPPPSRAWARLSSSSAMIFCMGALSFGRKLARALTRSKTTKSVSANLELAVNVKLWICDAGSEGLCRGPAAGTARSA
ncbi:hypothetical protein D3C72_1867960 [compost metagenome]